MFFAAAADKSAQVTVPLSPTEPLNTMPPTSFVTSSSVYFLAAAIAAVSFLLISLVVYVVVFSVLAAILPFVSVIVLVIVIVPSDSEATVAVPSKFPIAVLILVSTEASRIS